MIASAWSVLQLFKTVYLCLDSGTIPRSSTEGCRPPDTGMEAAWGSGFCTWATFQLSCITVFFKQHIFQDYCLLFVFALLVDAELVCEVRPLKMARLKSSSLRDRRTWRSCAFRWSLAKGNLLKCFFNLSNFLICTCFAWLSHFCFRTFHSQIFRTLKRDDVVLESIPTRSTRSIAKSDELDFGIVLTIFRMQCSLFSDKSGVLIAEEEIASIRQVARESLLEVRGNLPEETSFNFRNELTSNDIPRLQRTAVWKRSSLSWKLRRQSETFPLGSCNAPAKKQSERSTIAW